MLTPTTSNLTPWPLFPPGTAIPGESASHPFGNESHTWAFPDDEHITNVSLPTLTPMLAPHNPSGASVIVAPGGGYAFLAWSKEGTDIAKWLNSINVSAFVLKYRTPARSWLPFGGAPLIDAQRAMGLVRSRAKSLGLRDDRVGFIGFSAGGHLSGHLAATAGAQPHARAYPRIDAADALSCRPDFNLMIYPWCLIGHVGDCQQNTNLTVNVPVSSKNPPAFLVQAEDDPVHSENALEYFLALKTRSAPPSELHVYPNGGHGYGRCTIGASKSRHGEVCSWPERAASFLNGTAFPFPLALPFGFADRTEATSTLTEPPLAMSIATASHLVEY